MAQGLEMAQLLHDLKTPITVASGAAQLALEAGGMDVSVQLQQILQAIGTMDRMLSTMGTEHDLADAFTGGMLREELYAMLSGRAQAKRQQLSIDLGALDGGVFRVDYAALCRLLLNLLGNAVKYTQEGGTITMRAQMERGRRAESERVRFVIADNGPGMTRAFVRQMYTPFARAMETADRPGEGLGLAIARDMARRLGGTIRVHSERGRGTTFVVCVPVKMERRIVS